jgi:hypothetical protein
MTQPIGRCGNVSIDEPSEECFGISSGFVATDPPASHPPHASLLIPAAKRRSALSRHLLNTDQIVPQNVLAMGKTILRTLITPALFSQPPPRRPEGAFDELPEVSTSLPAKCRDAQRNPAGASPRSHILTDLWKT